LSGHLLCRRAIYRAFCRTLHAEASVSPFPLRCGRHFRAARIV
jgi:hypothetical protein